MASKKTVPQTKYTYDNPPETLDDHIFFGLDLDDEQKAFRDAIWDSKYDCVITDACAGSGKTTIAVATSIIAAQYGRYHHIIYQQAGGVYEKSLGYLPGSLQQKSMPLFAPLYQAVERLGLDSNRLIASEDMMAQKDGMALIYPQSDSYIRGTSFGEKDAPVIIILDEAQNLTLPAIRTSVTRVNEGSKLIVIGEQKQCDLKYQQDSGFPRMISVFKDVDWCKICPLTKNYRGRVSALGDKL